MIELHKTLNEALRNTNVSFERFQLLAIRLLDSGAIVSGDSQHETELYLDATRVEDTLHSYFDIIGCTLFHDDIHEYFRLYPPGSEIPGQENTDNDLLPRSLRLQLSQNEIAAALVLRLLYSEASQSGQLDEYGEAVFHIEAFNTAMATQLNRPQPSAATERRAIFLRLRALKIIRFPSELDISDPAEQITIRPMITSLIHEHALEELLEQGQSNDSEVSRARA